jgi:hypothetical protein
MIVRVLPLADSGEHLGAEPALPYLSPELEGEKLLVGANFASAGVGILNDTGVQFGSSGIHIFHRQCIFLLLPACPDVLD